MLRTWAASCVLASLLGAIPGESVAASPQAPRSCAEPVPFWKRAQSPSRGTYCRLLTQARARIGADPGGAKQLALRALALSPAPLEARLVVAQATLFLGDAREANKMFSSSVPDVADPAISPILSPDLVLAASRAALLSGDYGGALERYRWVLLRLDDLHRPGEEARVLIEAATVAAYHGKQHGLEARAYLAKAVDKNAPLLRPIAQAAWALSFHREGNAQLARKHAAPFVDSWGLVWIFDDVPPARGLPNETLPVLPPGEHRALAAAVAEVVEPDAAPEHWGLFVDEAGPKLPEHLGPRPSRSAVGPR